MKKCTNLLWGLLLALFATKASAANESSSQPLSITVGEHTVRVYYPQNYDPDKKYKTVVGLHGCCIGDPERYFLKVFALDKFVDEMNYILLLPLSNSPTSAWNMEHRPSNDILGNVIRGTTTVTPEETGGFSGDSIDLEQVYVTGYSAGARAAYLFANKPSIRIKGIASLAGDGAGRKIITGSPTRRAKPDHPMNLVHIHSVKDFVIQLDKGIQAYEYFTKKLCQSIQPEFKSKQSPKVMIRRGSSCDDNITTSLYRITDPIFFSSHHQNINEFGIMRDIMTDLLKN